MPTQPLRTVHDCIREAAELYEQGWTGQPLGARHDCSAEAARKALIRHGVPTRRPWERG